MAMSNSTVSHDTNCFQCSLTTNNIFILHTFNIIQHTRKPWKAWSMLARSHVINHVYPCCNFETSFLTLYTCLFTFLKLVILIANLGILQLIILLVHVLPFSNWKPVPQKQTGSLFSFIVQPEASLQSMVEHPVATVSSGKKQHTYMSKTYHECV